MSVILIEKYSKLLEPVMNALQSKNLDLLKCSNFIKKIVVIVKDHREHADTEIQELIAANKAAENIEAEINLPRIVKQQQHRSNPPALNSAEFWKRSLLIPYLDSLISSLERRFSDENLPAFAMILPIITKLKTWKVKQNYGTTSGRRKNWLKINYQTWK